MSLSGSFYFFLRKRLRHIICRRGRRRIAYDFSAARWIGFLFHLCQWIPGRLQCRCHADRQPRHEAGACSDLRFDH